MIYSQCVKQTINSCIWNWTSPDGLKMGMTYYVKVKAMNELGTAESNLAEFATNDIGIMLADSDQLRLR